MKKRKIVSSLLVVMLIMAFSGVSAFADEVAPVVEEAVINEDAATEDSAIVDETVAEEPATEAEASYLRFDMNGEDLIFTVEDGVIVSVSNELNLTSEEPAVEEPAVEEPAVEEPVVEEPVVEEPETEVPVDPYAAYLGLTVTEGVELILAEGETEESISVDIFANGETADGLQAILEENYAELLDVKTVALDSDDPNAERFLNAAIYKITPGKMNLLEKLGMTFDESEIDYATWSALSVKEIQDMTKSNQEKKMNTERVKSNKGKAKSKKK